MIRWPSFNSILACSFLLRVSLITYSEYYDALPTTTVKYTDVDYRVFTDAARYILEPGKPDRNVAQGFLGRKLGLGDPYTRPTYRYTPLLAVIMTPNIFLHPAFGKSIFATCDILTSLVLFRLAQQTSKETANIRVSILHLFNPLIFSISTRGSSESILGMFVLVTLYNAMKGRWDATAIWFGLSVHWKIYPIIYGSSLLMLIGQGRRDWAVLRRVRFGLIAATTFFITGGIMYAIWGHPFLEHTYLYHLTRKDYKHNFSPYFYPTYLSLAKPDRKWSMVSNPLISFLPQMLLSVGSGFALPSNKENLAFIWFVQTVAFVAFNKVCTSQYFLWYMWFLPLIVPRLSMSLRDGIGCVVLYVSSQAIWLSLAYRLEFLGESLFLELWLASLGFFVTHCFILARFLKAFRFSFNKSPTS